MSETSRFAFPGYDGDLRPDPATPSKSNALCPLAALPWKRPNIGSRMNREVHVRISASGSWVRLSEHLSEPVLHHDLADPAQLDPEKTEVTRQVDLIRLLSSVSVIP